MSTFTELQLIEPILRAVKEEGYTTPTPIQAQSIPHLLKGRDLLGCAQTGTGKTAAFVLPILQQLSIRKKVTARGAPRALILAPTRELTAQIGQSIRTYGKYLRLNSAVIFGGVSQFPQVKTLRQGIDILVATPGRLFDLLNQGHVRLNEVEMFVLDEADRMLDMGFIHDIKRIIAKLPTKRQSLFLSATLDSRVVALARTLVHDPVHVTIEPEKPTVDRIQQSVFFVDKGNKDALLTKILRNPAVTRAIVFTLMKHVANNVAVMLNHNGIRADAIHGNKSQGARSAALDAFRRGKIRVLVATDIAARGIDIDDISHVINYELPNEPESYVHRIGRTARAGSSGVAISFCSSSERDYLQAIERLIRKRLEVVRDPNFHSDTAMNATGAAARPPPRGGRGGRRNGSQSFGGGPRRPGFSESSGRSHSFSHQRRSGSRSSSSSGSGSGPRHGSNRGRRG
ncbi:DEAD/DEAH box helicase [Candidatus Woesearchaeota archaeon]|nr:DEAD/DEAH box helicase [Candidatus Woesearchaeota archaeon]